MSSTGPTTVIIPFNLGNAGTFDQDIFPLAYYEDGGNNLSKGSFLIKATKEEMEKIEQLGIDLNALEEDFIYNTRVGLQELREQERKIKKDRNTLNPFKAFLNYRAARLFHAGSRALYLQTKRTSENIQRGDQRARAVQIVPSTQMREVNGVVPPETALGGIAVDLPGGYDDSTRRMIDSARRVIASRNPFDDDPTVSQLREDEQAITLADTSSTFSRDESVDEDDRILIGPQPSLPTSPLTVTVHIHNPVVTTSSTFNGLTINRNSQNSTGASVTQELPPR